MAERILYQANIGNVVREMADDEEGKPFRATFVAATERAVNTHLGPEILRMTGARLQRFRKNPVILDTHNRAEASAVIGRGTVKRTDTELMVEIEFANTERARDAAELTRSGFLNAVSVGFAPNPARTVRLNAGERDGDVEGPAIIIKEWELLEISLVPVPADEDALIRRSFYGDLEEPVSEPETHEPTRVELMREKREYVMALCPKGLEPFAEQMLLEDKGEDEIRSALLERHAASLTPVGTPEPVEITHEEPEEDVSDDVLLRSLKG